jgi:acyl-CoA synthetase (AMP-forming)/AMP-acid ligase II
VSERLPATSANIASHLPVMARAAPDRAAIVAKVRERGRMTWKTLTFAELDAKSDAYAAGLVAAGIGRGVRTVLMVPPSLEFFPLVFGLFKAGAVMVLIDPGIARKALLACLDEVAPQAFIGVPRAHLARLLFPKPFRGVKASVTVGPRFGWGGHSLTDVERLGRGRAHVMFDPGPQETAAILFTSGSTGIPKGVVYTHAMFDAQVRSIRATYEIEPGEVDLPTFPLFALFDPALGMTAVLPEMDFRFPARADPAKLVEALTLHRCTNMFGSPALLDRLGRYGVATGVTMPHLRRVLSAGAPVRTDVLERLTKMLTPDAQVFTPFGATESLPVASIGSHEVLRDTARGSASGRGVCVGKPVLGSHVRIIRITDDAIGDWSDDLEVPPGTIGEITVRAAVVTREYYGRAEATRLAKIRDGDDVVHRMGDVGAFDEAGRLWMCGRKNHRVETGERTLFTVPVEEILNTHPAVRRTALVGVGVRGHQRPVVLVERERGAAIADRDLLRELAELATAHEVTRSLATFKIYPRVFPVDTRHNAKIERERLARWAESHIGAGS